MNSPLISIIIPVYNKIQYLPFSFNSVYTQTYANWEIVVVDDNSDDGSYDFVVEESRKDHRVRVYRNTKDINGPSICRNIGIEHAAGDFLIFFDADDLLKEFCLSQRLQFLSSNPQLDFAIFNQEFMNDFHADDIKRFTKENKFPDTYLRRFVRDDPPWQTMAVLWRKQAIISLGGFDISLLVMEDPEIHIRALLTQNLSYNFCTSLPSDNIYRINSLGLVNSSSFFEKSITFRLLFYKKIFYQINQCHLSDKEKKALYGKMYIGVLKLFKYFLLVRISMHKLSLYDFINWMKSTDVFHSYQIFKLSFLINLWQSNHFIIKKMRLKGLCYKLLLNV